MPSRMGQVLALRGWKACSPTSGRSPRGAASRRAVLLKSKAWSFEVLYYSYITVITAIGLKNKSLLPEVLRLTKQGPCQRSCASWHGTPRIPPLSFYGCMDILCSYISISRESIFGIRHTPCNVPFCFHGCRKLTLHTPCTVP